MLSVRSTRVFHGSPISLGAIARVERRTFPLKVSDLANVVVQPFSNHISEGDVEIGWTANFASNGTWSLSAHIADSGTVAGDYYVLDFFVSAAGKVGSRMDGKIEDGHSLDLTQSGVDPWIRDNWGELIDKGLTVRLTVTPDVAAVIGGVITVLFVGLAIAFFGNGKPKEVKPCPGTFEENKPCFDIKDRQGAGEADPGEQNAGGDSSVGTASFHILPG